MTNMTGWIGLNETDIWTILLMIIVTLLVRKLIGPQNLPPGPRGLPFLGAMLQFRDPKNLHKDFTELSKKYGEVFSLYMGRQLFVVLNSYGSIKEAFQNRGGDFSGRPAGPFQSSRQWQDEIFTPSYSDEWKKTKLYILRTLKTTGFGTKASEDKIIREINVFVDFLQQKMGSPVNLKKIIQYTALNVMLSVQINVRFSWDSQELKDLEQSVTQRLRAFHEGFDLDLTMAQYVPFFILKWLKSDTVKFLQTCDVVFREFLTKQISLHRETFDPDNMRDFLDYYLRDRPQVTSFHKKFIDTSITFFVDGVETLGSVINWILFYLLHHPDVQYIAQKQIDEALGSVKPRLEHRPKLTYIDAIIYESLRLSSVFPILPFHGPIKDTTLYGYNIPKRNTFILANVYAVHMNPEIFPEPEKFKPSRFIENGHLVNTQYVLQFSTGPRKCIGSMMARSEFFLLISNILQSFTLKPPKGAPGVSSDTFTPDPDMFGIKPKPFKLCAIPR